MVGTAAYNAHALRGQPGRGDQLRTSVPGYRCRRGFLVLVLAFVLIVFHRKAPRGMLRARFSPHSALVRPLSRPSSRHASNHAPLRSGDDVLFHDELPGRDVLVRKQSLQPSPPRGGSAAGARTMGSMAKTSTSRMLNRFRERARAVRQRGFPSRGPGAEAFHGPGPDRLHGLRDGRRRHRDAGERDPDLEDRPAARKRSELRLVPVAATAGGLEEQRPWPSRASAPRR